MAFQPTPQEDLLPTEQTRYMLTHPRNYMVPDAKKTDEAHIHNCYEVYVNVSGNVFFLVNDRIYPLEKYGVILTRPNDVHVCVFPQPDEYEHYCLWINDPEEMLFPNTHTADFEPFISLPFQEGERLLSLLMELEDSKETKLRKTAAFFEILALLENRGHENTLSMSVQISGQMQQILLYMNASFLEIEHISEICDRFYVSQATLNRWFRKYAGISPGAFLESKKLAYAKQRLSDGETVTQAASQAGFSDCSHFIRIFKKKFGETPKTYQRRSTGTANRSGNVV